MFNFFEARSFDKLWRKVNTLPVGPEPEAFSPPAKGIRTLMQRRVPQAVNYSPRWTLNLTSWATRVIKTFHMHCRVLINFHFVARHMAGSVLLETLTVGGDVRTLGFSWNNSGWSCKIYSGMRMCTMKFVDKVHNCWPERNWCYVR